MAVTFYLDKRPNKAGEYPIGVSIYLGARFCSTTGYSIAADKWDSTRMRVKKGCSNCKQVPYNIINARLAAIASFFDNLAAHNADYSKAKIQAMLSQIIGRRTSKTGETVRTLGTAGTNETTEYPKLQTGTASRISFFEHWNEFLLDGKINKKWALNTQKKWGTLSNHIKKFNDSICLDDFDRDTLNAYVHFAATDLQMLDVSINKELSLLRWYLGWCVERGYTANIFISKYKAKLKDTKKPIIFLTKDELLKLYEFKIPKNGTKVVLHDMNGDEYQKVVTEKASLDKVRDLFCFCACTSLRYSDMAQLRRTHIVDGKIHITTIKTDDSVTIPVTEIPQEILDKYAAFDFDGLALPVISNQKMNQYLKEICELCEFNDPKNVVTYLDGKRKDSCLPKWKVMSTHAARRTFICIGLAAGVPPQTIMKFTGHSDYKSMKPYIEVAEKTKDDAMSMFEKFLK